MMNKISTGFVYLFFVLLYFADSVMGQEKSRSDGIREGFESEYYYAFTEATRYMIYQYYNQAAGLYNKCLEYNPGSAAIKYQLSKIYYRTGFIEEAKRMGIEAWNSEKQNRWYLLNLITIYQTTNKTDSAILFTKELIGLEPERAENYFNVAILYQISGEYRKSLKLLEQIEKHFGKSMEVLTLKYSVYQSMKDHKQAVSQLYSAHEKYPDNLSVVGMMAEFYRDSGVQDSASKYYDDLLRGDNRDPLSVFSYIDYLVVFTRYNEAMQYFTNSMNKQIINREQTAGYFMNKLEEDNKILEHKQFYDSALDYFDSISKDDLRISALYVDYQLKIRNYTNAAEKLKEMMVLNERNYRIWEQLLFTENIMNQYDSLLIYGERAIAIFEDQPLPYLYTGIAYLQKKNYSMALKTMEKGYQFADNKNISLQYCIFIAEAYNGVLNREKSFEFYKKALSIDSANILVMNNYAYFLAIEGKDLKRAEYMSRQTIKKERSNAIYLDTYAWILYKMKRNLRAKCYIRKAMKHGGGSDAEVTEHYSIILKKQGENKY
jgi:tetratricopeptide (TPR) repeat protein